MPAALPVIAEFSTELRCRPIMERCRFTDRHQRLSVFRLFVGGIAVVLLAIISIGCSIEPPDPPAATGSGVEGYVRDDTGRPIAGATIELLMQNGNPVSAEGQLGTRTTMATIAPARHLLP